MPETQENPLLLLGDGSNVLFTRDYEGLIIHLATRGIEVLASDEKEVRIRAAAGENWDKFVRWSLARGFRGLENLILIPGTVGAAPIQNIGAYGIEVSQFVEAVEAFDLLE
ncbi:MAG: FAD-binding protein, partial [Desulfoferrobacter sp.]